jgi:hypothetical protein
MVAVRAGATTQVPVMGMTVGLAAAKHRVPVIRVRPPPVRVTMVAPQSVAAVVEAGARVL